MRVFLILLCFSFSACQPILRQSTAPLLSESAATITEISEEDSDGIVVDAVAGGIYQDFRISTGWTHTCVIADTTTKTVKCFGGNTAGELGRADGSDGPDPMPVDLAAGDLTGVLGLSDSSKGTIAITATELYSWGANTNGELGNGLIGNGSPGISTLLTGKTFTKISLSGTHACGLLTGSSISCWGSNWQGQFGNNTIGASFDTLVTNPATDINDSILDVATGSDLTCLVRRKNSNENEAWCFGVSTATLGNGISTANSLPVKVTLPNDFNPYKVIVSKWNNHRVCLIGNTSAQTGVVACWGDNSSGVIIDQAQVAATISTPLILQNLSNVQKLGVGHSHMCAQHSDGTVSCWGNTESGRLGSNAALQAGSVSYDPIPVEGLTNATELSCGRDHCCAFNGSTLQCWGINAQGQTGGPGPSTSTPFSVSLN